MTDTPTNNTTDAVGVGIIGVGYAARAHVASIDKSEQATFAGFFDRNSSAGDWISGVDEEGGPKRYSSYEEMLADPSVEIIIVATPAALHPEHVIAALEAGKTVLCEKPPAVTLAAARTMMDAADAAELEAGGRTRLIVSSNRLFTAAAIDMRERLARTDIDEVKFEGLEGAELFEREPALASGEADVIDSLTYHPLYQMFAIGRPRRAKRRTKPRGLSDAACVTHARRQDGFA